jgi:hypothetical protein
MPNFLKNRVSLTQRSQHVVRISTWNFKLEFQSADTFLRTLDRERSVAVCQSDANLPFSKAGDQAVPQVLALDTSCFHSAFARRNFLSISRAIRLTAGPIAIRAWVEERLTGTREDTR